DWSVVMDVSGGDADFERELVEALAVSATENIEKLMFAMASTDFAAMKRAAHSLKGAAASVGANATRDLAKQVEEQAAAGNTAALATLLEDLLAQSNAAVGE